MEKEKMTDDKKRGDFTAMRLVVIGASIAALAGTIYFFLGPKGKQHQRQTRAWAIKMKGDVVEKLENARELSESAYHGIIDSVAAEYEKGKKATRSEISALSNDLKRQWNTIIESARIKDSPLKGMSNGERDR